MPNKSGFALGLRRYNSDCATSAADISNSCDAFLPVLTAIVYMQAVGPRVDPRC